jgi:hypothetical protein
MTDGQFDQLTRTLERSRSRRSVVKVLAAGALGGALSVGSWLGAGATSVKRACSREGQSCEDLVCCPTLVCVCGVCQSPKRAE